MQSVSTSSSEEKQQLFRYFCYVDNEFSRHSAPIVTDLSEVGFLKYFSPKHFEYFFESVLKNYKDSSFVGCQSDGTKVTLVLEGVDDSKPSIFSADLSRAHVNKDKLYGFIKECAFFFEEELKSIQYSYTVFNQSYQSNAPVSCDLSDLSFLRIFSKEEIRRVFEGALYAYREFDACKNKGDAKKIILVFGLSYGKSGFDSKLFSVSLSHGLVDKNTLHAFVRASAFLAFEHFHYDKPKGLSPSDELLVIQRLALGSLLPRQDGLITLASHSKIKFTKDEAKPVAACSIAMSSSDEKKRRSNEDRVLFFEAADLEYLKYFSNPDLKTVVDRAHRSQSNYVKSKPIARRSGSTFTGCLQVPYPKEHRKKGTVRAVYHHLGDTVFWMAKKEASVNESGQPALFLERMTLDHDFKGYDFECLKVFAKVRGLELKDILLFSENGVPVRFQDGVNMARALGDLHCKGKGLIDIPDIELREIKSDGKHFLLFFSDGFNMLFRPEHERACLHEYFTDQDFSLSSLLSLCLIVRKSILQKLPYRDDMTFLSVPVFSETKEESNSIFYSGIMDGHTGSEIDKKRKPVSQIVKETFPMFLRLAAWLMLAEKGQLRKVFGAPSVSSSSSSSSSGMFSGGKRGRPSGETSVAPAPKISKFAASSDVKSRR